MKKIRINVKKPWIGYPGSAIQQNYAEDLKHGYFLWDIESKDKFDVKFNELPNVKPFVTIKWQGSVEDTISFCKDQKAKTRFRIYSPSQLSHKDTVLLSNELKAKFNATEVTFKTDSILSSNTVSAYNSTIEKSDLRNSDTLFKLFKEFHSSSQFEQEHLIDINNLIKGYVSQLSNEEIVRNSKWSLKHLKFDNVLAYGESNVIDFDKLSGIVGIFGPNRIGKSSVVGTIMYSLFNSTDRGSVKNMHVVNMRKPHCYSRAIINCDGVDYAIERQTVKSQNKKGQFSSSTSLNVFKILNGEAIDLVGEQRSDTEKVVRSIIGTQDDFLLTSLSAQDELKLFISQGSSKRRQILTKFLDLDVFDKLYDLVKTDLNNTKAILKSLPEKDWSTIELELSNLAVDYQQKIDSNSNDIEILSYQLDSLKSNLLKHGNYVIVTPAQLSVQEKKVKDSRDLFQQTEKLLFDSKEKSISINEKIESIKSILHGYDIENLNNDLQKIKDINEKLTSKVHDSEKKNILVKQNEKSLKILEGIPCGDSYPSCKFIKDAFSSKENLPKISEELESIQKKIADLKEKLEILNEKDVIEKVSKYQKLSKMLDDYNLEYSKLSNSILKHENSIANLALVLEEEIKVLKNLRFSLENEENLEISQIKFEIEEKQNKLNLLHKDNVYSATELGKTKFLLQRLFEDKQQRDALLDKSRMYDYILNAFSKKGIPSKIISSQLPLINSEIANILQGIVDFSIELEHDDDSESMEVYINYGDSKRIIELCSGMEKMIASVAIRVALINISTLPKTDMFIIDEGFGALDEQGVESCNRLLTLLKKYFKTVIVITHVEGIKDSVDTIIEVQKNEKDAKINHE
jgi:DNA repair exonuclease SbcCD ATPase subunit